MSTIFQIINNMPTEYRRIAAFVVDHMCISFCLVAPIVLIKNEQIFEGISNMSLVLIVGFAALTFKDVFGRSIGKRLMGIKITEGGKAPKVWKRIVRNLSTALWDVEFLVFLLRSDHRKLMDVLLGLDVVSDTRE